MPDLRGITHCSIVMYRGQPHLMWKLQGDEKWRNIRLS